MSKETILLFVLLLWLGAFAILLTSAWRSKRPASGLVIAYFFQLWIIHWIAGAIQLIPWHTHPFRLDTLVGFEVTGYAVVGLLVGNFFLSPFFVPALPTVHSVRSNRAFLSAGTMYVTAGLVFAFILLPMVGRIPTLNAVLGSGLLLAIAGYCLLWWGYWSSRQISRTWLVLASTSIIPALGLFFQGFLSYGIMALGAVAGFVAVFYRPRWTFIVVTLALLSLGLSLYPTYMRFRTEIREKVWGGASYSERFQAINMMQSEFQWFDPETADHLEAVEMRLNQDWFIGRAAQQIDAGNVDFAYGETIMDAMLAMIPRIVWPTKPFYAGSGNLVRRFTGLQLSENTSWGIGHIMELYVNFGYTGVFLGFVVLGTFLGCMDWISGYHLRTGNWKRFVLWFVPGLSFLAVGGNFAEATAGALAGWGTCWFFNHWLEDPRLGTKSANPLHATIDRRNALKSATLAVGDGGAATGWETND